MVDLTAKRFKWVLVDILTVNLNPSVLYVYGSCKDIGYNTFPVAWYDEGNFWLSFNIDIKSTKLMSFHIS